MTSTKNKTNIIVECALMIAIATALELISKLIGLELPFGGTITLASMFPIILVSYKYGIKNGFRHVHAGRRADGAVESTLRLPA